MKTLKDIIDFVWDSFESFKTESCEKKSCEYCHLYNWCYIDSILLSIDCLYDSKY